MSQRTNELGQPIGAALPDWTPRPQPSRSVMEGRFCRLEPLDPERHADALWAANAEDATGHGWTYLSYGPFPDLAAYRAWVEKSAPSGDPMFFAIVEARSGKAAGIAAYLRIDRNAGAIEVGHLHFAPRLRRTAAATEAMFLMMRHAFDDLGYRRYEWKCDTLNGPSRAAAERLGFRFEGVFRQATVYKGRTRDTAWFSIIDQEWPALKAGFERWLQADNFDGEGRQRTKLFSA